MAAGECWAERCEGGCWRSCCTRQMDFSSAPSLAKRRWPTWTLEGDAKPKVKRSCAMLLAGGPRQYASPIGNGAHSTVYVGCDPLSP